MTQEEKNQQVAQPAAEQKQPTYPQFNSAADIDARFMQMMERDAERDRAEQQRRLQRQQFAQSMGDLGNVLIDTIKMSGGALVTPRDVSARYQQMDAQGQRIYDTYRARMDLTRKYAADKAEAERQRKWKAEQDALAFERQKELTNMANENKVDVAKIRAAATVDAAQKRGNSYLRRDEKKFYVPFAGKEYPIDTSRLDGRMSALYAYLENNKLFPEEAGANEDMKTLSMFMQSGNTSNAPESSLAKVRGAVLYTLGTIPANSPHAANIISILNSGVSKPVVTGSGSAGSTNGGKSKKQVKGFNGYNG